MKRVIAGAAALMCSLVLAAPAQAAGSWHEVALPFLWPRKALTDIGASGPDNVWISGYQGYYCVPSPTFPYPCIISSPGNPVVRRWNGSKWLEYPLTGLKDGTGDVNKVEVSGSEVWITQQRNDYVGRFDGTAFRKMAMPKPGFSFVNAGPAGVWARQFVDGHGIQYRWTGSGWAETPLPSGVTGLSGEVKSQVADEAWSLTSKNTDTGHVEYSLMYWNGSTWQNTGPMPSLDPRDSVTDMTVVGPGEVVAVVDLPFGIEAPAHLFRYKNGTWTPMEAPPGSEYWHVFTDGTGSLVANGPSLLRNDGSGWKTMPKPPTSLGELEAVPGSDALWGIPHTYADKLFSNS